MRERDVEHCFVESVKNAGGLALKFVSPGYDGMPDRLVIFPGGRIAFVEMKAPGGKPRDLQIARHKLLESYGFRVFVVNSPDQIEETISAIESE